MPIEGCLLFYQVAMEARGMAAERISLASFECRGTSFNMVGPLD
jgi:hypothetical protein